MNRKSKNLQGFTLWEVLLVMVLLGLIAFLAMPVFNSTLDKTKLELHESNMLKLKSAVELYYMDTGSYPTNIQNLLTKPLTVSNWRGPYIKEIPIYTLNPSMSYAIDSDGEIYLALSET